MAVRDLFARKDLGVHAGSFGGFVGISGVLMVRLSAHPKEASVVESRL